MQRLAAVIALALSASTTAHAEQSRMPNPKLTDADVRMAFRDFRNTGMTACSATYGNAPASRHGMGRRPRQP